MLPDAAPDAVPDAGTDSAPDSHCEVAPDSGRESSRAEVGLQSEVTDTEVCFRLADPEHDLTDVWLWHDVDLPDLGHELAAVPGGWELRWPRPPVDRIEYQFTASHPVLGDHRAFLIDPRNPLRVEGAFGAHSWLALPGYRPPAWLDLPSIPAHRVMATVSGTPVDEVDTLTWSPADAEFDEPLPMLFAHDGPELDRFAHLTHLVGALIGTGRLPRMRVTLLVPGVRNPRYAASAAYADALANHVVPALLRAHPTEHAPVLVGPSLGGLAALHAEWTHPGTFGGLLLLSGSFFTPELDGQESGFEFWGQLIDFVAGVHDGPAPSRPQLALGWGTAEENRHNNALMAARLTELGLSVRTGQVRDGHNFTCWRDLLDPLLPDLLTRTWLGN